MNPMADWIPRAKASLKKVYGVATGDNTLIYHLTGEAKYDSQIVRAHVTITYQELFARMGLNGGNPSDADAVVTALNLCAYHVTFNLYDDDYDARNPRWGSTTGAFGFNGAPRAGGFIAADGTTATGRAAIINEAQAVVFRRKTALEEKIS